MWRLGKETRIDASAFINRRKGNAGFDTTTGAKGAGGSLPLVTALFFLWGIPNNLNDVLIRQFMKSFAISRFQAGLVQSAFYMGYFSSPFPPRMLMRRNGYKVGILIGLLLFAVARSCSGPPPCSELWFFSLRALRHRQRACFSGDGVQSLDRAAGPPESAGAA